MLNKKYILSIILLSIFIIITQSCEKDTFFVVPPPHVAGETTTLEAGYTTAAPTGITSAYWRTADYLRVNVSNTSINQLYSDGFLNMTGTYAGETSFNGGADAGLTLKAAYDNDKLYILAEWSDSDINLSDGSWLWKGPADALKTDSTNGWTSQRNNDKISFAFEIQTTSSSFGTFSSVGCAASCHNTGSGFVMHPNSGKADIWNWTLARSAPMGYAEDMAANQDSLFNDAGLKMFARNSTGTTSRSGPMYEWDGTSQSITLPNGQSSILSPSFYLYYNNKTLFTGDIARGDSIYHSILPPGDCASCHGGNGQGGSATAVNGISLNKKSRATLSDNMDNQPDMTTYWTPLSAQSKNDIIAYMRGLSGVPGYYLTTPSGSCADIIAVSNVTPVQITSAQLTSTNIHTTYKVLIIRKLNTNNSDDVKFDLSTSHTYKFGVALMDNDGRNHIGSTLETLTFKQR